MTIAIVSSVIANKYLNGGNAWVVLNWLLGLKRLGFDVYFVEQIERAQCVDAKGQETAFENSVNRAYFKQIVDEFGFAKSATLLYDNGAQALGLGYAELLELADAADLLINITGHLTLASIKQRIKRKVYLDLDPGFTQFWHALGDRGAHLDGHDFYFTIGENIGMPFCSIPTNGIEWRAARQPAVLEQWQDRTTSHPNRAIRFTTIATWRGPYGRVAYAGKNHGLKVHEFRKFITLPECTPQYFELALDIHPAEKNDLRALQVNDWHLVDPKQVAGDPNAFRAYVQTSDAEFSAAQGVYVETNSGWFSDRTVRYLASGKPALVQDTGFSCQLPVGEGLIAFRTLDEAIEGTHRIARDYAKHARAARAVAAEYFDSDKVLTMLLDRVGVAP